MVKNKYNKKEIIIYYINVDGLTPYKIFQIINDYKTEYNINDKNIIQHFIPVTNQQTKVEYLTNNISTKTNIRKNKTYKLK